VLDQTSARDMIGDVLGKTFLAERRKLDDIDNWYRWKHDKPHAPNTATREYRQISERAQTPWGSLIVTSVAQALYVDDYRRADGEDSAMPWEWWQANHLDHRQTAIHRAALAYGQSFVVGIPGRSPLTGEAMPQLRGVSPRRMTSFYLDAAWDDWPAYALEANPAKIEGSPGWDLKLYDDQAVWRFHASSEFGKITYVTYDEHGVGVCPVVRFANALDLEGRSDGEIEPFIPLLARIDQTTFDRLIVQRYGAWIMRTISGMAPPEELEDEDAAEYMARITAALRVSDILVADDPDTKFGSLPATPLDGFIKSHQADIGDLAAVSQTPAHEMLGQMANLSAEALAAARASLTAKVTERQQSLGESHEQVFQLAAVIMGQTPDPQAQVRWRDTEIRSMAQAADALGKMAQMLGVPVELLWEKIPGFTQQDLARAKVLAEASGGVDALLRELVGASEPVV
jgi:hypothetical protein